MSAFCHYGGQRTVLSAYFNYVRPWPAGNWHPFSRLQPKPYQRQPFQYFCFQARKVLPAAAFVLTSEREATDIALALNATVDMFSGATARWAAADLLKERGEVILSPADRVRQG